MRFLLLHPVFVETGGYQEHRAMINGVPMTAPSSPVRSRFPPKPGECVIVTSYWVYHSTLCKEADRNRQLVMMCRE